MHFLIKKLYTTELTSLQVLLLCGGSCFPILLLCCPSVTWAFDYKKACCNTLHSPKLSQSVNWSRAMMCNWHWSERLHVDCGWKRMEQISSTEIQKRIKRRKQYFIKKETWKCLGFQGSRGTVLWTQKWSYKLSEFVAGSTWYLFVLALFLKRQNVLCIYWRDVQKLF